MAVIPQDALVVVASWLPREKLLPLRAVSVLGRDAVAVAVRTHPECVCMKFDTRREGQFLASGAYAMPSDPVLAARTIDAIGRVFGRDCRKIIVISCDSPEVLSALSSFVHNGHGRLTTFQFFQSTMSVEALLEICRASPCLRTLEIWDRIPLIEADDISTLAASVSLACPLLSKVRFDFTSTLQKSPMETWACHFPKLRKLQLGTGDDDYIPSDFAAIEGAASQCVEATKCDLYACIVTPDLVQCLVSTPLSARLTSLSFSHAAISPETIIDAARGFDGLISLKLPDDFDGRRSFYESLARARPELKRLNLSSGNAADDSCVEAICNLFQLEKLVILSMNSLTNAVVDMILESSPQQTLQELEILSTDSITELEFQALVAGIPSLRTANWQSESWADEDDRLLDAIGAVLESRGGGWDAWMCDSD